jgi:hypothetical protein
MLLLCTVLIVISYLRYFSVGFWTGIAACIVSSFLCILAYFCEYQWPKHSIDICPDYSLHVKRKSGNRSASGLIRK